MLLLLSVVGSIFKKINQICIKYQLISPKIKAYRSDKKFTKLAKCRKN